MISLVRVIPEFATAKRVPLFFAAQVICNKVDAATSCRFRMRVSVRRQSLCVVLIPSIMILYPGRNVNTHHHTTCSFRKGRDTTGHWSLASSS